MKEPAKEEHRPKRWLVWVLSLFLSFGTGHFYAGERARALRWFGLRLSALFLFFIGLNFGAGRPALLFSSVLLYSASYVAELTDLRRIQRGARPRAATHVMVAFGFAAIAGPMSTAVLVREFVLEAFRTPSGSMLPSIFMRDHFFVRKAAPRSMVRGDVVVFEYPDPVSENPRVQYVKRVIGMPGDRLEFVEGHPILNGWPVPSCLVATIPLPGSTETTLGELHVEFLEGNAYLTGSSTPKALDGRVPTPLPKARCSSWATIGGLPATREPGARGKAPEFRSRTSRGERPSSGLGSTRLGRSPGTVSD